MNKYLFMAIVGAGLWMWRRHTLSLSSGMSVAEAAQVLNVKQNADAATINAAYKRLIVSVHPDTGGSAELAAQVNRARDVLLRRFAA